MPKAARLGLVETGGAQEVDSLPFPPRTGSQHQLQPISNQVEVTCQEMLRKIVNTQTFPEYHEKIRRKTAYCAFCICLLVTFKITAICTFFDSHCHQKVPSPPVGFCISCTFRL